MIAPLTEQEWQTNEAIARRLNVVIEAVGALRRQVEQHIAAEDGADPVEGEQAADGEALDLDAIISRGADLAECLYCGQRLSYEDEWQAFTSDIPALIWEVRSLRAERDAALARGAELEQERDDLYQQVDGLTKQVARLHVALENAAGPDAVREAIYQSVEAGEADYPALGLRARQNADDAALGARVAELEADAALGALVRRAVAKHRRTEIVATGNHHDVLLADRIDQYGKRQAIHGVGLKIEDALRAALGDGGEGE